MSRDLTKLAAWDDKGALRVIVESPRGSSLKLEFDPELRLFTVARELPLGIVYPFDWGFIPGTRGDDGDPVDAMVLHHASSSSGVLLPCRALGMVQLVQRKSGGRGQVNNRIIATPRWHTPLQNLKDARDLPRHTREEIEQFFVAAAALTGKRLALGDWAGRRRTEKFVRSCTV